MNATQLLAHFDRLVEAPDAVPRLRRFILDLAVRGKLVAQDGGDEPAAKLLMRIQAEKARLIETGSLKASKPQPATEAVDSSLIPGSWRWTRLVDVGFISPRNTAPDDQLVSFVPMPMIAADYGTPNQHEIRPWREIKTGYTHFGEGDVGLAKITPCFENGKSTVFRGLTNGIGAGTTELHIVRPVFLSADYILIYLKSSQYIATGIPRMTGTAGQKRVPTEYFTQTPFPLPPLAEQHRIVAKVDELMTLCDQLEAAQQERERRRARLATASLQRLNQPAADTPPEAQRVHARFHLQHLPRFTSRPEHIKAMRQTILYLAVRGKLVEQDAGDEPAVELLKRITLNAKQSATSGKAHKVKPLSPTAIHEEPYPAPVGWSWVRMGFIGETNIGLTYSPAHLAKTGTPVLRSSNVQNGKLDLSDLVRVATEVKESVLVQEGDLLICARNGSKALVGKTALISGLTERMAFGAFMAIFRSPYNAYLLLFINSPLFRTMISDVNTTTINQITQENLKSALLPFPPLAEQHRIVAKVDELMALCDQLETQLTATQTDSRRLLEAVLEAALAPT